MSENHDLFRITPKNQNTYVPISIPEQGVTMTYVRAPLVIRDTDGTEVITTEIAIEQRQNYTSTAKVVMSLDQGVELIGMLIAHSGLSIKDVMKLVDEVHAEAEAEVEEAMQVQTDQAASDGNYCEPGNQSGSLYG